MGSGVSEFHSVEPWDRAEGSVCSRTVLSHCLQLSCASPAAAVRLCQCCRVSVLGEPLGAAQIPHTQPSPSFSLLFTHCCSSPALLLLKPVLFFLPFLDNNHKILRW